jgi:hypothetical protein
MVGLGGPEPPTSPLSVVDQAIVMNAGQMRLSAIQQCLREFLTVGDYHDLPPWTTDFDPGVHQFVHQHRWARTPPITSTGGWPLTLVYAAEILVFRALKSHCEITFRFREVLLC